MLTNKRTIIPPATATGYTPPDTSKWLSRNEASDWLACSQGTLSNYERRGLLHPQLASRADSRGVEQRVIVYSPDELNKLAARLKRGIVRISPREVGELHAMACEMFNDGKTNAEVIIALRETFENVDEFRLRWTDATKAELVISPAAKETLEKAVGPFKDIAELVALVTKLAESHAPA